MFVQPGEEKAEERIAAVLETLLKDQCSKKTFNGNLGNQLLKFHLDIKELFLIVMISNDWKHCQ